MSDYTPFSEIIRRDDPRFNEIWDEHTSTAEVETKEESQHAADSIPVEDKEDHAADSIPVKDKEDPPGLLPIHKEPTKGKSKLEKIEISSVTADDQSVISTISKSTFLSAASNLAMASVLVDASIGIDGELSEITAAKIEKTRSERSLDSVFVNLYESVVGDQPLNCVSEEAINDTESLVFTEATDTVEDAAKKPSKQDEEPIPTIESDLLQCEDLPAPCAEHLPAPCAEQANNMCSNQDSSAPHPTKAKSAACKIFFNDDTEPITNIPEFMASAASQFRSSSFSINDDITTSSIVFGAGDDKDAEPTSDLPTETLQEKRLDERSLLDSLLPKEEPVESPSSSQDDAPTAIQVESTDEENVTEGLGLKLPSPSPQPQLDSIEEESSDGAHVATIEVDETGRILIDDVDSTNDGEADTPDRDVYISYRIEVDQSDGTDSLSYSHASANSNTSVKTPPKQNSGLKYFLKPRWGRKMKLFGSSGTKDNKTHKKNGVVKPTKSVWDSPGSATVETAETAMSMTTYATLSFVEDHPVNPRKLPFLRRRSKA